jgi:hypothetical protein
LLTVISIAAPASVPAEEGIRDGPPGRLLFLLISNQNH